MAERVKLTKRVVDAAQSGEKDRFVWDTEVKGFGLRVTPGGKKTYVLQYRMGGRGTQERRYTIGTHGQGFTPDQARSEAIRLRGRVESGVDVYAERQAAVLKPVSKPPTFAETADRYLARAAKDLRPSTYKEWKRILDRDVVPAWGKRPTESITRRDVRELVAGIADRGAEVQANRTRMRLHTLFAWAVKEDIITASPVAGVDPVRKEKARDRALTDGEIRWFWRGCDRLGWPFGPLFQLLLLTAQRRDEVGTLEWREIEIEKRLWTIPREKAKNDRAHLVHLSERAVQIIAGVPRIAEGYVFTTNGERPVSGFSKAKERLDGLMEAARREEFGLPDDAPAAIGQWILHDLRRTAATAMAGLNIPPHIVDKVLNHVSGTIRGVAAVYNRQEYLAERRVALEAWGRYIDGLVSGGRKGSLLALRAS